MRYKAVKVLEGINYKKLEDFPELNKPLLDARIDTNDSWGPYIVLFTASKVVMGDHPSLPEGEAFLVVEVVGQRHKKLRISKKAHN